MKKAILLLILTTFFNQVSAQEEYGEFLDNALAAAAKYAVREYNINMKYFITALERDSVTPETLPTEFFDKYLQCVYAGFLYEISLSDEFKKTVLDFAQYGADNGNTDAMVLLGFYYNDWRSAEKDEEKSAYWYKMAAENGNPDAMVAIGALYQYGTLGFEKDAEKSKLWSDKALEKFLQKAQEENEENDLTLLGLSGYYFKKQDYEEAKKWLLKLAERGNIMGMVNLAGIYVLEANYGEAVVWVQKAAEKEQPGAMLIMGAVLAMTGKTKEALIWYQKACDTGHRGACELKEGFEKQLKNQ